jgi:hypothetical protein
MPDAPGDHNNTQVTCAAVEGIVESRRWEPPLHMDSVLAERINQGCNLARVAVGAQPSIVVARYAIINQIATNLQHFAPMHS